MNISGIILVLFAAYLIYQIQAQIQETHFIGGAPQFSGVGVGVYSRQYKELDDVDHVLTRPLVPGKKDINELIAYNAQVRTVNNGIMPSEASSSLVLASPAAPAIPAAAVDPILPVDKDTRALIEARQPAFLREALIINGKYYYDRQYPQRPVSIDFARDPEKYVREHPDEYPSYVRRRGHAAP
jgi:hypothetical protein